VEVTVAGVAVVVMAAMVVEEQWALHGDQANCVCITHAKQVGIH
jgi:hypothetical protein